MPGQAQSRAWGTFLPEGPGMCSEAATATETTAVLISRWSWANGGVAERMPPVREWYGTEQVT